MRINLLIPPEPIQTKRRFKEELEKGSRLMQANIKQGTWIASPLWTQYGWGNILKSYGFSWQHFMEAVRDNYYSFIQWINRTRSWDETIKDLIAIIERRIKGGIYIDVRDLGFLTLKTKSGKWLKPEEIILSQEYYPDHQIKGLIRKGLLDLPVELLSDVFVQDIGDEEILEWRRFFKELGVDKKLQDRKFRKDVISRIGIKTAIKYEESKGRSARELGRSEEISGYDITPSEESDEGFSLIQSQERYIEVKSSAKTNPDIFLTTRQFATLQEKREKYFVYVVRDALRNPTLCVTRGDRLLKITEIKTIIPFSKWWENAKEEFQP